MTDQKPNVFELPDKWHKDASERGGSMVRSLCAKELEAPLPAVRALVSCLHGAATYIGEKTPLWEHMKKALEPFKDVR